MAAGKRRQIHNVQQMEKVLLFLVCMSKCLKVIQIDPVKQPITCNSVGPWHMSHCWTSTDNCWQSHFPYGLVLDGLNEQSPVSNLFPNPGLVSVLASFVQRNTSITTFHKSMAGNPSVPNPAPNEVISDSVELWDTDVCFLHIEQKETNVRHPNMHKIPPDVDFFESSKSPAKSKSWISPIDNVVLHFPHSNIDDSLLFYECMRSILPIVYHKLVSILCKFVHWTQHVWSTNSCKMLTLKKNNLWANFWQFSNWFQIFLLELVIIQARTGNFVKLLCLLFRQFALPFHTLFWACPSMS